MGAKNKSQAKTNAGNQGKQGGKGKGGKGAKANTNKEPARKPGKVGGQKLELYHILCTKESKYLEALSKVEGPAVTVAEFKKVAEEYSEDKARSGGYLGWQTKGDLDADFVKVAWSLEKSESNSIKTNVTRTRHGYHIIIVTG